MPALKIHSWNAGLGNWVGGAGFVATLRAYFYTRGLSGRNLKPAPWFSVALIFYFALGEVFFRGYLQRLQGQMIGGFGAAIPGDLGESLLKGFFCLPGSIAQPSGSY